MRADYKSRTTVLLTGFGSFPGVPVNATMLLVPRLAASARKMFPDVFIADEILPTEWARAPQLVDAAVTGFKPDVVLHFGVSSRARGFEIETRGANVCAMASDAAGCLPVLNSIDPEGQTFLRVQVPVTEIVMRLRRRGIAAFASRDAGTYLCNRTLYHSLAMSGRASGTARVGFIHVPAALAGPRMAVGDRRLVAQLRSPLTWEDALAGGLEIIGACIGRAVRIPGSRINRPGAGAIALRG